MGLADGSVLGATKIFGGHGLNFDPSTLVLVAEGYRADEITSSRRTRRASPALSSPPLPSTPCMLPSTFTAST